MGIRTYKGTFYGAFITCKKYSEVEAIILNSGILPGYAECMDPSYPDKKETIPNYGKINIVLSGNSVIGGTEFFLGMKIDGKNTTGLKKEIETAKKQLDEIFKKISPLEKDNDYRIETLSLIS